ncbi:MAG TPA: bifunctional diaminohydroxyphosphoribosylaminopyrimidine deaminase/5-amino-6-(5-phosphoribosylamino)uracil reductase RibD [Puia sp.]
MSQVSSPFPEIKEDISHEFFMQRCLQLADLGAGYTAPNPLVGAILVHQGRIIGEGYHQQYGEAHAEVNCLNDVQPDDRPLIPFSTMYVSLEPCCHFGKTPPCSDLILREQIPRVVIGCRDPFPMVAGKGIEKLQAGGVQVIFPLLENQSLEKNRRFITFHEKKRPYVVLKWAESANHKIAHSGGGHFRISNDWSNRLVHKWRAEEAGILIGTNTAFLDNPELTARLWPGKNPVRIVLDQNLRLPQNLKLFDGTVNTIVLNGHKDSLSANLVFKKMLPEEHVSVSILASLYDMNILSVLVEGGRVLLQSFIKAGNWDEIRIITNEEMNIPAGLSSPEFNDAKFIRSETFGSDTIRYYKNE